MVAQFDLIKCQREALENQYAALKEEHAMLMMQSKELTLQCGSMIEENDALKQKIGQLEAKNFALTRERVELGEEGDARKRVAEEDRIRKDTEIEVLKGEIKTLQMQCPKPGIAEEKLQKEKDKESEEVNENSNQAMQILIATLHLDIGTLKSENAALWEERGCLKDELGSVILASERLESEYKDLQSKYVDLKSEHESLKGTRSECACGCLLLFVPACPRNWEKIVMHEREWQKRKPSSHRW